ncbi:MAG: hypothetical protein WD042_08625 [Phycisphaeraceae bacterium]
MPRLLFWTVAGIAVLSVLGCGSRHEQSRPSISLVSAKLRSTQIVPTLDTPLNESGNAVWCATFQVAWNRAKEEVIGQPLRIANAQAVADRLNASPVTEAALPAGSYYAAAGRLNDGVEQTIRSAMSARFPQVTPPVFGGAEGFVSYAYLDTKGAFTTPLVDTKRPLEFVDAAGVSHRVAGFGLHEGTDWDLRQKQAAQIRVLFAKGPYEGGRGWQPGTPAAYALDLTADQTEQQVIVAVLPRREHLRALLDELTGLAQEPTSSAGASRLSQVDTMAIPNVVFRADHAFTELAGGDKVIQNAGEYQGLFIAAARQTINFRLDKSGAAVISESHLYAGADPRHFIVNRPFLIVMKLHNQTQPYFVAWIENIELLDPAR